jgi:nucleoside-diphosphate-sugar epimerase
MRFFAVTGANGFIGRCLVNELAASGCQVRALTRRPREQQPAQENVEWITGDIADPDAWSRLLVPGCTVINLAYSGAQISAAAVESAAGMIEACASAGIARLVHCSTVSVYGRERDTIITEKSECNPVNDYGKLKLAVEREIAARVNGRFTVTIARPSVVFGSGGEALNKLMNDLASAHPALNYCRSSLFGRRRTHLVPVETVSAALRFLCDVKQAGAVEVFIVSDSDDPLNNFRDVERICMEEMALAPYRLAPPEAPRQLLETLMRLRNRPNVRLATEYSNDKLLRAGFVKPVSLESALRRFARSGRQVQAARVAA